MSYRKKIVIFLFAVILFLPLTSFAAEVLQIRSSTNLQLGDRNRSYSVNLPCIEVDPEKELSAMKWLKLNVKRGNKVNLKPEGASNGVLLARVTIIDSKIDLGESLVKNHLAKPTCDSI